jgi:hypothetical protein
MPLEELLQQMEKQKGAAAPQSQPAGAMPGQAMPGQMPSGSMGAPPSGVGGSIGNTGGGIGK